MIDKNDLINRNNGINSVFKDQPKQEETYVYTLMIYDYSSKEEKTFEKINSYINSICIFVVTYLPNRHRTTTLILNRHNDSIGFVHLACAYL